MAAIKRNTKRTNALAWTLRSHLFLVVFSGEDESERPPLYPQVCPQIVRCQSDVSFILGHLVDEKVTIQDHEKITNKY